MPASDTDKWLSRAFAAASTSHLAGTYDEWAASYDADMLAVGYVHPTVAAGFVGRYVRDRDARILDAGAGTGILGQVLSILGYTRLIGIDMSEGMLARARARGVYAELHRKILGEPLGFADGSFAAVASTGVFTEGHAPPAALDELLRVTRPGGHLIFSVGHSAWEEGGFGAHLEALEAAGRCRAVEATRPYQGIPLSPEEGEGTGRMFVYEAAERHRAPGRSG